MHSSTIKTEKPAYMEEYVTKKDLKEALSEQTHEFAQIVTDLGNRIAEQMHIDKTELKSDIRAVKKDVEILKEDVSTLKTDMKDVKADLRVHVVGFSRMAYAIDGFLIEHKHPTLASQNPS